jgi:hypothetical protein
MVEKDVRDRIYSVSLPENVPGGQIINMVINAASNESLNPLQLMNSLVKFKGKEIAPEDIRITRKELYYTEDGKLRSLFEK